QTELANLISGRFSNSTILAFLVPAVYYTILQSSSSPNSFLSAAWESLFSMILKQELLLQLLLQYNKQFLKQKLLLQLSEHYTVILIHSIFLSSNLFLNLLSSLLLNPFTNLFTNLLMHLSLNLLMHL